MLIVAMYISLNCSATRLGKYRVAFFFCRCREISDISNAHWFPFIVSLECLLCVCECVCVCLVAVFVKAARVAVLAPLSLQPWAHCTKWFSALRSLHGWGMMKCTPSLFLLLWHKAVQWYHRVIILNRGSMFAFQWREFSPPLSSAHRLLP